MTPGGRLEAIFRGQLVDRVPFALKGWRVPQCEAERQLRNRGMGVLDSAPVYAVSSPNVTTTHVEYADGGVHLRRTTVDTPKGPLTWVSRPLGSERVERTSWTLEHPFKAPEDYVRLKAMVQDRRYAPCYEVFERARESVGGEAFFKTGAPGCALHTVLYTFMGPQTFAVEWAERRDEILSLCAAMTEN